MDIVIRNGTVVDGTGAPARRADVGIADGRIVAIGDLADRDAGQFIDATGRVVCPGFVDVHTHYDAQVFWDNSLTPSSLHGVTSVFAGNCGFTVAPLSGDADDTDYLLKMLARVEGMPVESLQIGVPWTWRSTGEYLEAVEAGGLGINIGLSVGHSTIRRVVMGPAATRARSDRRRDRCHVSHPPRVARGRRDRVLVLASPQPQWGRRAARPVARSPTRTSS